jgi:hypothetical protein
MDFITFLEWCDVAPFILLAIALPFAIIHDYMNEDE